MSSKKPEFANSVRTAGTSETGRDRRVLAVPRAWLGALTLLLVVPWVAVIAFYFAGAPRRVVVEPVTPPPPAHSAAPGPWGLLTVAPIVVSPPLEYVGADWGGWRQGPAEWYFPGASPETLEAFLLTAGMSREQVAPILSSSRVDPGSGGLVVTPDPDLVRGLTPELRAHLYLQLAKTTRNYDQANAFRFFGATTDEWLRGSLMSPDSRRLIEPLIYRDGAFLRFSDVELLRSQIHDPAELRRIAKTLLRESTMLVRLTVNDGSEVAGLADGTLWLKWPNDLVAHDQRRGVIKVAGVLGESVSAGERVESAVVGIGINGNWKAADFPWLLASTMTSLRELSKGRPIDHHALLDAYLARLEPRYEALRAGTFDAAGWSVTQITTGRQVVVEVAGQSMLGTATGVEPESGALLFTRDGSTQTAIDSGEVVRCRVA